MSGWIPWTPKRGPLIGWEEENITAQVCEFSLFGDRNLQALHDFDPKVGLKKVFNTSVPDNLICDGANCRISASEIAGD